MVCSKSGARTARPWWRTEPDAYSWIVALCGCVLVDRKRYVYIHFYIFVSMRVGSSVDSHTQCIHAQVPFSTG